MAPLSYQLTLLPGVMAICRLEPQAAIPTWVEKAIFLSITHTPDELSILCEERVIPAQIHAEGGWRAMKIIGPLEFSQVGVLTAVLNPLAEAQIPILAISTYDTDYVLVGEPDLPAALAVLRNAGHQIFT